ncbi:hypothetical protein MJL33_29655, partial [Salmonella enterica subsp. enterica serovar Kentucky]|nr:hypothetical protein [Salmonella enterica subsp. enterica serovar Kentucky]
GSTDQAVRDQFNSMKKDLGYGLLLKRYTPNVTDATEAQIQQAGSAPLKFHVVTTSITSRPYANSRWPPVFGCRGHYFCPGSECFR